MPEQGGILMYESALDAGARRKLGAMGGADILIGIPSHRNGRTIGQVVDTIAAGVRTYLGDKRVVLMNADGGSSDNTVRHIEDVPMPSNVATLFTIYEGATGKGTAVRAIFQAAGILGVKACLVLEARIPGMTPEWLPALLDPVLRGDDMTLPCYQRSAYGAALTDNLAYPFVHTFMNADLREPVPFEYCLSGALARQLADMDVWETDVARFGVNVWMAIQALTSVQRVSQVDLGYRGDCSGEPGAALDARFLHTAGTLFRVLATQPGVWDPNKLSQHVPFQGMRCGEQAIDCPECADVLWQACLEEREKYVNLWEQILLPETFAALERLLHEAPRPTLPVVLWARVVVEFATEFNQGEGDPDKVIEALLPIYYARAASYMVETAGMTDREREQVMQDICRAFAALKPFGAKRWHSYETWDMDETTYWLT